MLMMFRFRVENLSHEQIKNMYDVLHYTAEQIIQLNMPQEYTEAHKIKVKLCMSDVKRMMDALFLDIN